MRTKSLTIWLLALAIGPLAPLGAQPPADPAPQPAASAQADPAAMAPEEPAAEKLPSFFATTTVTAVGREVDSFEVATPVTVISQLEVARRQPNNAADLLREQPGVDVNGVGPNQARPVIRGQRGLRVLFLEDGLRMNNARRQTDFGEIPGIVDLDTVETVEVVRGPASVLYGSDAIGGVLNLITRAPAAGGARFAGSLELRGGSAADLWRAGLGFGGEAGRFFYRLSASQRESEPYEAPTGEFGEIRLRREALVEGSGVEDDTWSAAFGLRLTDSQSLTLRHSSYDAGLTGFGFVDPALVGGDTSTLIRITYPFQKFERTVASYDGAALASLVADSLRVQAYRQRNRRELANDIDINIGPIRPGAPNSSLAIDSLNFTDLETLGLRAEAIKLIGDHQFLTYGFEYFDDDSFNTDRSRTVTTLRFAGPPFQVVQVSEDNVANSPNAKNESWGLFAQDELMLGERLKLTLGARYQTIETRAQPTPGLEVGGLDFSDDAFVGAATAVYQLTDTLNLLASYGRAFRAPNIVERLFNGPTPEGDGFQILNPGLTSETSDNVDLGIKYRRRNAFLEVVYFRNEIQDGIIQDFLDAAEIAALPADLRARITASRARFVVQQRNLDELRYEGVELAIGYRSARGFTVGGNYSHLSGKRVGRSAAPVEDQYSDKVAAYLRYERPSGRFWTEYRVRFNDSTEANLEPGEPTPAVGRTLPSFVVHTLAGGVTLFERGRHSHQLTLAIENLTDELYAEFSNATFFRPEPGRNVVASYRLRF